MNTLDIVFVMKYEKVTIYHKIKFTYKYYNYL